MTTEFRFIEYNPRRFLRGAEAARVAVIENGKEEWLWMSESDIAKNMMRFGSHPELVKAHDSYQQAGSNFVFAAAPAPENKK